MKTQTSPFEELGPLFPVFIWRIGDTYYELLLLEPEPLDLSDLKHEFPEFSDIYENLGNPPLFHVGRMPTGYLLSDAYRPTFLAAALNGLILAKSFQRDRKAAQASAIQNIRHKLETTAAAECISKALTPAHEFVNTLPNTPPMNPFRINESS